LLLINPQHALPLFELVTYNSLFVSLSLPLILFLAKVIEDLKAAFPELTPEQLEDLRDLEDEHYEICSEIRSERAGLVGAFKELFDEKAEKTLSRVVKLSTSLELFRQNYIDEGNALLVMGTDLCR
jgi:hypothetical protein